MPQSLTRRLPKHDYRGHGIVDHTHPVAHPINIVTATYLDPRRYDHYKRIWLLLGMLSTVQFLQYLYIRKRAQNWRAFLDKWITVLRASADDVLPEYALNWVPFKRDFLPLSVHNMLKDFAWQKMVHDDSREGPLQGAERYQETQEKELEQYAISNDELVEMGAHYVNNVPNVVFLTQEDRARLDSLHASGIDHPLTLGVDSAMDLDRTNWGRTAWDIVHSLDSVESDVNSRNGNSALLWKHMNYQQYEALTRPLWKSRFVPVFDDTFAEGGYPTMEELDAYLADTQLDEVYEDEEELPGEFDRYLFHDFLDDMEAHRSAQPERDRLIDNSVERTRYILKDIERDRERIVRQAIEMTMT